MRLHLDNKRYLGQETSSVDRLYQICLIYIRKTSKKREFIIMICLTISCSTLSLELACQVSHADAVWPLMTQSWSYCQEHLKWKGEEFLVKHQVISCKFYCKLCYISLGQKGSISSWNAQVQLLVSLLVTIWSSVHTYFHNDLLAYFPEGGLCDLHAVCVFVCLWIPQY
jgi:hypothetical protein